MAVDDEKKALQEERRKRLKSIGTAIHGPRYTKDLAEAMGASQEIVSQAGSGTRNVSDQFEESLLRYAQHALPAKMAELQKLADELGIIIPPREKPPDPEPDPDDDGPAPSI